MDIYNQKPRIEEISNKNHVSDIKYAVQHTRWILTILGIWPSVISNPTRSQRYLAKFTLPFCPFAIAVLVGSIICHATFRATNFQDVLEVFGPITYQTEANWRRLETPNDRKIMTKYLKLGRDITIVCVLGLYGTTTLFYTAAYFAEPYTNELNQSVRPPVLPGADMFVDIQSGHNYEIVYVTIYLCVCSNLFVHLAIYNLASVFVTHACGQIQIVISRLETLVGSDDNVNDTVIVHDRIAFIVRNHVRVIRFATKVEECLRELCLVEVLVCIVTMCWFEYWLLTDFQKNGFVAILPLFLPLIALCFNLLTFCHISELLKDQFEQIGRTSYMIDWHRLVGKTGLALVLVITMANYPCTLTAGRIMELSYFSFANIIKASFAYLNMMQSVAE